MKALVPVFLLLAASAGFSQTATPEGQGPDRAFTPDSVAGQVEASRTPNRARVPPLPFGTIQAPRRTPPLDGRMVLHPPKESFAQQTPRPPLPQAQRLYPDLKLLPIRERAAWSEPVPVPGPDGKIGGSAAGRDARDAGASEKVPSPGAGPATQPDGRVR